ncbi:MAG: hypothetical protein ABI777_04625 [Betaproteobacteria bacterium]
MPAVTRLLAALLLAAACVLPVAAADPAPGVAKGAADQDGLRSVLQESKDKNRGVAIYTNGATINAVVVAVDDRYVIAKNQQSSRIVIRVDRIDGVATQF